MHPNAEDTPAALFRERFLGNRLALSGSVVILALMLLAAFAPLIAPFDPSRIDTSNILAAPSASHLLGTDELGRDVLTRMIYSGRISLLVGFVAAGIATAVGVVIGAVSGYYGGVVDSIMMRFVDIM